MPITEEITQLLREWRNGRNDALDQVFPLVYDDLRRIAANNLKHERVGHTLQPTALVNELYLSFSKGKPVSLANRVHFFKVAAKHVRHILVDYGRKRSAEKRGGGQAPVTLEEEILVSTKPRIEVFALEKALKDMEDYYPEGVQMVELKYFLGRTNKEIGEILKLTERGVEARWTKTKRWLFKALREEVN
ncbi:MAG TPA: ECF-type sigma factor [Pyrinomonadaceae bacterium]|nr:ECF-type sigma factor [Pyrinomonadaceae bacterium]